MRYPLLAVALFSFAVTGAHAQNHGPKLIEPHDDPVTPDFLAEHSLNGFCVVEAVVTADGKLAGAHPLMTSSPDLAAKYAADTAKVWRYQPAEQDGKPIPSILDIPEWFVGDMRMTDADLTPLVRLARYMNQGWAMLHGLKTKKEAFTDQAHHELMLIPLKREGQHVVVDAGSLPKGADAKAAAEFITKYVSPSALPDSALNAISRLGTLYVILPVLPAAAAE